MLWGVHFVLCFLILPDVYAGCHSALTRKLPLCKTTGTECQALQLGPAWNSPSPLMCILRCQLAYPSLCYSVIYNENTFNCVPASTAFGPVATYTGSIPHKHSDDAIYYLKTATQCSNSLGLSQYENCGSSACLYVSSDKVNYLAAQDQCALRNSSLFVADSLPKFSLFWHVISNSINDNTFLGLSDIRTEGHFVWANEKSLSSDQDSYIWSRGNPNDYRNNEDCVDTLHGSNPELFGLNDATCSLLRNFVCENNIESKR